MSSRRLRCSGTVLLAAIVAGGSTLMPPAHGQHFQRVEIAVSEAECTCRPAVPSGIPIEPGCILKFECYRTDIFCLPEDQLFQGTEEEVQGMMFRCDTCRDCGCPQAAPTLCYSNLEVCATIREVKWQLGAGVSTPPIKGVQGAVEAQLGGGTGATRCFSVTAGSGAVPPCQRLGWRATLTVWRDRVFQVTHRYHWRGTKECGGFMKPTTIIQTWLQECAEPRTSVCIGDAWGFAEVQRVDVPPCSETPPQ